MRSPFGPAATVRRQTRQPSSVASRKSKALATLLVGAALALGGRAAVADDTGGGPPRDPETKRPVTGDAPPPAVPAPAAPLAAPAPPKKIHARPAAPPKPPLPVQMTVVAASPDPPWTLRIKNIGDHPIRIAADTRLLTFELDTGEKRARKVKCTAPSGLRPGGFPNPRELYLEAGESYSEDFDPRLYCFGDSLYLLHAGTTVRARLGWSGSGQGKAVYVAQGVDRPEEFAGARELAAPPFLLGFASYPPDGGSTQLDNSSNPDTPTADRPSDPSQPELAKSDDSAPHESMAGSKNGDQQSPWSGYRKMSDLARDRPADGSVEEGRSAKERSHELLNGKRKHEKKELVARDKPDDRNAEHVDVYVDRFKDAHAPRDVVINIRAVNEGKRQLVAAIRGRMLSFTVEELGPDNKPRNTVECSGADGPHAMPAEAIQAMGVGKGVSVPIMLAEICPKEAFERPGLYRIRPRIDTNVDGEVLEAQPYIGKALALQPALVRVATSSKPFQEDEPRAADAPRSDASRSDPQH